MARLLYLEIKSETIKKSTTPNAYQHIFVKKQVFVVILRDLFAPSLFPCSFSLAPPPPSLFPCSLFSLAPLPFVHYIPRKAEILYLVVDTPVRSKLFCADYFNCFVSTIIDRDPYVLQPIELMSSSIFVEITITYSCVFTKCSQAFIFQKWSNSIPKSLTCCLPNNYSNNCSHDDQDA